MVKKKTLEIVRKTIPKITQVEKLANLMDQIREINIEDVTKMFCDQVIKVIPTTVDIKNLTVLNELVNELLFSPGISVSSEQGSCIIEMFCDQIKKVIAISDAKMLIAIVELLDTIITFGATSIKQGENIIQSYCTRIKEIIASSNAETPNLEDLINGTTQVLSREQIDEIAKVYKKRKKELR